MEIKQYEHKGYTIEIHYDEWGESPREWDNLGTMACYNKRYTLGDDKQYEDAYALREYLEGGDALYLPIYMYDHGGIALSTNSFDCLWDSGLLGYIYVSRDKVKAEGLTEEKALAILKGEVDTYDDYVQGKVYGYKVFNDEGEELDSCWGFIGDMDHCEKEAESVADYYDRTMPKQYDMFCA